ncbi:MAG: bifunctional UDP-sugar hydrolase/5'-nucleotidase [Candidatus Omnitrophota bacterium]|nr:bifunctional metallophosphatase/5'-nucleotidase [bacterium]MBU3929525.1 bifunctional metallophosphatase/5'-nucleotidase [bacterium]MBU4122294.1 bifunctional metallophosphatase/5'-nucleotidase [bacterium]
MKRVMKIIVGILLAGFVILASREIYVRNTTDEIYLVYTSDIHGHVLPEKHYDAATGVTWETGGAGSMSAYLSFLDKPYLLLDAGDIFMGTPEGALGKGEFIVKIMNDLKYSAVAAGNHELDYGLDNFRQLSVKADFPFLCCNLTNSDGSEIPFVKPYEIFDVAGYSIGVIGVIEEDLHKVLTGENAAMFAVRSASASVQRVADELAEKCHAVVVLSGLGLDGDKELARQITGVDIIAGGETHIALEKALMINGIMVCEPGWGLRYAGKIKMRIGKRGLVRAEWKLDKLLASQYPSGNFVSERIGVFENEDYKRMNIPAGSASMWIQRYSGGPVNPMGNLVADAMRIVAGTDFAFQNEYGIRAEIAPGTVRIRDLVAVSPFGNKIVTMKLTGSEIRELLEQSATKEKGLLQMSGLKMIFNSELPKGRKLLNVIVKNAEIDPEKEYTVATNSFLAGGGDGFVTFKKGREIRDAGMKLLDATIEYFKNNSPVGPSQEERVTDIRN